MGYLLLNYDVFYLLRSSSMDLGLLTLKTWKAPKIFDFLTKLGMLCFRFLKQNIMSKYDIPSPQL